MKLDMIMIIVYLVQFSLTKNADINKNKYSGYGMDLIEKDFIHTLMVELVECNKGPTQGLEYTMSPEKMYSINFTENNKIFCLSLNYNGANSYLFVNGKEIHKFEAK